MNKLSKIVQLMKRRGRETNPSEQAVMRGSHEAAAEGSEGFHVHAKTSGKMQTNIPGAVEITLSPNEPADPVESLLARLPEEHIIAKLVGEHETILCFLEGLEVLCEKIWRWDRYYQEREEVRRLRHIVKYLVVAQTHSELEETILFPELEKREITGPVLILQDDHRYMQAQHSQLKELVENFGSMEFYLFKQRLKNYVDILIPLLRNHIHKENHILFPIALKVIRDESVWLKLNRECGKVGI